MTLSVFVLSVWRVFRMRNSVVYEKIVCFDTIDWIFSFFYLVNFLLARMNGKSVNFSTNMNIEFIQLSGWILPFDIFMIFQLIIMKPFFRIWSIRMSKVSRYWRYVYHYLRIHEHNAKKADEWNFLCNSQFRREKRNTYHAKLFLFQTIFFFAFQRDYYVNCNIL